MTPDKAVTASDLERAASIAPALEQIEKLGALCYDVLGRQAEGRQMFSGKKFVSGRAKAHGLQRPAADTLLGNVLVMIERGPESAMQWALLSALFVHGFGRAVRDRPEERKALCARLAEHCDFFELESPYRVLGLIDRMLEPELAAEVQTAVAELVLRDDGASDPQLRARNAGRIAALGGAGTAAARAALARIETQAKDPYSRALAAVALERTPRMPEPSCRVRGRVGRMQSGPVLSLLSWLSGVALLRWLLSLVFGAVGYWRDAEVELCGDAIRVRKNARLLGRIVRTSEQIHPVERLRFARRASRYPALHLVLGALCFAVGLLLGGVFAFDAARVGDGTLWLIAALLLGSGAGLDLAFEVLLPGRRGRVAIELDLERKERLRIVGVELAEADAILQALARRLAHSTEANHAVA